MRTIFSFCASKVFFSSALNAGMVLGLMGAALLARASEQHPRDGQLGDMGSFIEERVTLAPAPADGGDMGDLGAFIKSLPEGSEPVIVVPQSTPLSDGKFENLSAKWKRGVVQVIREKRCAPHAKAFASTTVDPLFEQAQAIVESNCDSSAKGSAGEVGIFQVMPETCRSIRIYGNHADTLVNARCAEKYRQALCASVKGKCSARLMFLAHNRGIRGALKTAHAESTEYVRKVDCAARVLKGQRCA